MCTKKVKTINSVKEFCTKLNLDSSKVNKDHLNHFFKKRFVIIENNQIVFPKKSEIQKKIKEQTDLYNKLKINKQFWNKEKRCAENYHKNITLTKVFNKNFWRHKIKAMTNKEYKEDVIDSQLTDSVLMDPEYSHLTETFIKDKDYRKKLIETINNSLVYKKNKLGSSSLKKQNFKEETAIFKINKVETQIKQSKFEIQVYKTILKYIK